MKVTSECTFEGLYSGLSLVNVKSLSVPAGNLALLLYFIFKISSRLGHSNLHYGNYNDLEINYYILNQFNTVLENHSCE